MVIVCRECKEPATCEVVLWRRAVGAEPGAFVEVRVPSCGSSDCNQLIYSTVGLCREAAQEARRLHERAHRHAAAQHSAVH